MDGGAALPPQDPAQDSTGRAKPLAHGWVTTPALRPDGNDPDDDPQADCVLGVLVAPPSHVYSYNMRMYL
jgi:hypothetical protein